MAQGHAAARPALEALLAEAEAQLHALHVVIIDCLMPLVNCCRASGAGGTLSLCSLLLGLLRLPACASRPGCGNVWVLLLPCCLHSLALAEL